MDSPVNTRKAFDKEDPSTPMKFGTRPTAQSGSKMPSAPWSEPSTQSDIPLETKIWLSVFDDEPAGPFRREERAT